MTYKEKLEYGERLIKEDKYKEAFDIFCELRDENPKDEYLLETTGFLLHRMTEAYYDFDPVAAEDFLFRGVARFYKDELENSIKDYDQAILLKPKFDVAYYYKSLSLGHSMKYISAIKELEKAIAINPNCEYFNELAQNYFSLGKSNECYKYHELAIGYSPQNPRFWFTYGCHLSKANLHKGAIIKFKKAIV
jgi:tetratricopeptide (TPR) repeat protein